MFAKRFILQRRLLPRRRWMRGREPRGFARADRSRSRRRSRPQSVSASRRTAITEAVARVAPAVVTVQTEVVERVPVDPFDSIFGAPVRRAHRRRTRLRIHHRRRTGRSSPTRTSSPARRASPSRCATARRSPPRCSASTRRTTSPCSRSRRRVFPSRRSATPTTCIVGEWAIAIGNPYGFMLGNSRAERHRRRDQRDGTQPHRPGGGRRRVRRHDPDRRVDQSRATRAGRW